MAVALVPPFIVHLFFANFSAHADGERRGLGRVGGWHRKGLDETRSLGDLRIGTGPRRSPSARSETFFSKKRPPKTRCASARCTTACRGGRATAARGATCTPPARARRAFFFGRWPRGEPPEGRGDRRTRPRVHRRRLLCGTPFRSARAPSAFAVGALRRFFVKKNVGRSSSTSSGCRRGSTRRRRQAWHRPAPPSAGGRAEPSVDVVMALYSYGPI